jgi:phage gpG-like protein
MRLGVSIGGSLSVSSVQKQISDKMRKALAVAGTKALTMIKRRTNKGNGLNGKFKPYSKSYQAYKVKKGKNPFVVNLRDGGDMMKSMTARIQGDTALIYFTTSESNKKAYFNDKIRPFFDLTNDEKKKVNNIFTRYLK